MAALAVVVTFAVGAPGGDEDTASSQDGAASYTASGTPASGARASGEQRPSRSSERPDPPASAKARDRVDSGSAVADRLEVVAKKYVTTPLNLWSGPDEDTDLVKVLPTGTKVKVTGETKDQFAQVILNDKPRWVTAEYLSKKDPDKVSDASGGNGGGISGAPCGSGSSVESGLSSDAVAVHRAVCSAFPEVTSYGGLRGGSSEHSQGLALDIMVPSSSLGDAISEWVRSHSGDLGVSQVIWSQHIWTVQRSSEGWRSMPDRGSTTANHYDHVHVTVYGSSAG